MKTYLRFLLRRLGQRLRSLVRRKPATPPPPTSPLVLHAEEEPRQQRLRYVPIWVGGQVLAVPLFEEKRNAAQDFYEET